MAEPLGVGIVGMGLMGREHVDAFRRIPGVDVTCGYDTSEGLLGRASSELGVPACSSLSELLARPSVDIVSICTPESQHLDIATSAIQADKHVLIEKPLASSRQDGQSIVRLAGGSKKCIMVGQILRFDPYYVAAKRIVDDGMIGAITYMSARRSNSRLNALRLRGRTTVSLFLGVHDLDFAMWTLGSRAARVSAVGIDGVLHREHGLEAFDAVLGSVQFECGSAVGVEFSWSLPVDAMDALDARFDISGSQGQLALNRQLETLELTEWTKKRARRLDVWDVTGFVPSQSPLMREVDSFVNAVRSDSAVPVDLSASFEAMAVALALDESAAANRPVLARYDT